MTPSTSIIICSRDEGAYLRQTVESVARAATAAIAQEIIVVDDGSHDRSAEGLERAGVIVERTPGVGVASARNTGARRASGTSLVFLDAHSRVPPGWLEILTPYCGNGAGLVTPALTWFGEAVAVHQEPMAARHYIEGTPPFHVGHWPIETDGDSVPLSISGTCQMLPRVVFNEIGGFCQELDPFGGEDTEICIRVWRMGHEVVAVPSCIVETLSKAHDELADEQRKVSLFANHLKVNMMHFGPALVTQMWEQVRLEWLAWPDLFSAVWELAHAGAFTDYRAAFASRAQRSADDWLSAFPLLKP